MIHAPFAFTATLSDRPLSPDAKASTASSLALGFAGFTWSALRDVSQLPRLTEAFDAYAREALTESSWALLSRYRSTRGEGMSPEEVSDAVIQSAPVVADFLARLFAVDDGRERLREAASREQVIFDFKREFVKKRTAKRKRAEL